MNVNQKFQSPRRCCKVPVVVVSFLVTEDVSEEDEGNRLLVGLPSFSIITVKGDKEEEDNDVEDEVEDKHEFPSEIVDR
jgi:hypothetical protein